MRKATRGLDWESEENLLLLNPRLPMGTREIFQRAWRDLVEPKFKAQIGISTSGSSGATGYGTLIVLAKSAILESARAVNDWLGATGKDVWLKALPDFHVGGLGILARTHLNGADVYHSQLEKWDALGFHQELIDNQVSLVSLVPTQLYDLVRHGCEAPSHLRLVLLGGGSLENELYLKAKSLGWPVLPSYGMTECASTVACARSVDDPKLFPLSHVQLRIDTKGFVAVQSSSLLTSQVGFSGDSAQLSDPKRENWLITQDRGVIASDGSLQILGRGSDFIKIAGEGVVVSRLEERFERLRLESQVQSDSAILAAHDERLGAVIMMISEGASDGTSRDDSAIDLMRRFNNEVAPFERIRAVHRVAKIPRSELSKLLRSEALALIGLKAPTNL